MRKIGIFILGGFLFLNTSIAWASGECENFMAYMSCVASFAYFDPSMTKQKAQEKCDSVPWNIPDPDEFSRMGWEYGANLKYDLENFSDTTPVEELKRANAGNMLYILINMGFCYEVVSILGGDYYVDMNVNIDTANKVLLYGFSVNTCPTGGKTKSWGNGSTSFSVRDCYISNFSDTTGSGEYVGGCYYSE